MSLDATLNLILGVTPVLGLHPAFTLFKIIVSCVQAARASQKQLAAVAVALAQLLKTLQREFKSNSQVQQSCVQPLNDLIKDTPQFVQAEQDRSFLGALLHGDSRVAAIELFYHRIGTTSSAFQISSSLNIQHMLRDNENARLEGVSALAERFTSLERNHNELRRELDINNKNMLAIMVSIERRMKEKHNCNSPEQNFYAHTLHYLASTSGGHVKLEDWVISPFDVDYGPEIGVGGFGTVYKGTWKRTEVAIKLIHNGSGITANVDPLCDRFPSLIYHHRAFITDILKPVSLAPARAITVADPHRDETIYI
ncbi:hypothetical protein DFH09DRAFT_1346825 [Mycena vulgaris]|nr:hypothetical protein DFH09DRAFT_1346825 [Mycena vulgaris]